MLEAYTSKLIYVTITVGFSKTECVDQETLLCHLTELHYRVEEVRESVKTRIRTFLRSSFSIASDKEKPVSK